MRIGIDFDNTIACYEGIFHAAAVERGLIPVTTASDKTSVRNTLRAAGREDDWTRLQGYIYGACMDRVACYPGFAEFVIRAASEGHKLFVVSHKTRYPYLGDDYDLHAAARNFLNTNLVSRATTLSDEQVFFEPTLECKLARIATQRCDVFIDDLPEFLDEKAFPKSTRPVLFDPENHYPGGIWKGCSFERYQNWKAVADGILGPRT
jgi:hypothetical protein